MESVGERRWKEGLRLAILKAREELPPALTSRRTVLPSHTPVSPSSHMVRTCASRCSVGQKAKSASTGGHGRDRLLRRNLPTPPSLRRSDPSQIPSQILRSISRPTTKSYTALRSLRTWASTGCPPNARLRPPLQLSVVGRRSLLAVDSQIALSLT